MLPESCEAVAGALLKGGLTALIVGGLLVLAQRRGRAAAGLLAGLPTVTGPALLWLALDRGAGFAAQAAVGAAAAGLSYALFALVYGRAGRRRGPAGALALGAAASVAALPGLGSVALDLPTWLLLASLGCAVVRWLLALELRAPSAGDVPPPRGRLRGWVVTSLVSGLVSAAATGAAGEVGPFWAGMLTSPPLLAAAVALELHRQAGRVGPAMLFLHGYVTGLIGRGVFVAVVGLLIAPLGTAAAFTAAAAASLVTGRLWRPSTHATLSRRDEAVRQRA